MSDDTLNLIADLVAMAQKGGADAADAVALDDVSLAHVWRLGATEQLERSEAADIGLRVFVGQRQAIASSTDRRPPALKELAERAIAMARAVPEDPFGGLADADAVCSVPPTLDMNDPAEPAPEDLIARARATEEAALAVDGITNSEGAEAAWSRTDVAIAASNGFAGAYRRTSHMVSVSVLAGEGTGMERDYDYGVSVFGADLRDPAEIGRSAAERTLARMKPRKVKSCQAPVIYDPRVGNSLLGHLAGAITGAAIARGTSFLKDAMDTQVFADGVSVIDDPHRPRGLSSRPFDAEGLPNGKTTIIDGGRLTTWLLDLRSARQLGLAPTGHARRGASSPPSAGPSNLWMAAGDVSREDLIGGVDNGLYVTEMIGMGVNGVTGDYSRGASGFWIENGELAYPVSEITIAGNLKDMYRAITPANDLEFRYGTNAPTLRVDGMTIAGS